MRREETQTVEDLGRPDGNSLIENYELHDDGEEEFLSRLKYEDVLVEPWGIDQREDDGEEGLLYDDAMDFKVHDEYGELIAYVDVKTKSSEKWMGLYNLRHYDNYYDHANGGLVPAFVIMFQIGPDGEVYDEFVHKIGHQDRYEDVLTSRGEPDVVDVFPDGNHKAVVKHEHRKEWKHFIRAIST